MIYPVWRQQLSRSLHLHRSKAEAKYFQVASVDQNKLPALRTMVFRRFADDSNDLLSITDIRSEKFQQWQSSPYAELHWYFAKSREQYRLKCEVIMVFQKDDNNAQLQRSSDNLSHEHALSLYTMQWKNISHSAQSSFAAPAPGVPIGDELDSHFQARRGEGKTKDASSISEKTNSENAQKTDIQQNSENVNAGDEQVLEINKHYVLVVFRPLAVDYLDLKTKPHTRLIHQIVNEKWQSHSVNP